MRLQVQITAHFFIRNSLFSKLYKISADGCFPVFVFNTVFMYLITVTNYHTNIGIKHGLITGSMAQWVAQCI